MAEGDSFDWRRGVREMGGGGRRGERRRGFGDEIGRYASIITLGMVNEDGRGRGGYDEERFTSGEVRKSIAGDAEGAAVVCVCGGKVVAGEDGVFNESTAFFAAADSVFVV